MDARTRSSAPGSTADDRQSPMARAAAPAAAPRPSQASVIGPCTEIAVLGLDLGSLITSFTAVAALFSRFCFASLHLDISHMHVTCLAFRAGRAGRSVCRLRLPPALGGALLAARCRLAVTAPGVSIDVWRQPAELAWLGEQRQRRREAASAQAGRADAAATWRHAEAPALPVPIVPAPAAPLAPATSPLVAPAPHPAPAPHVAPALPAPVVAVPASPMHSPVPQGVIAMDTEEDGQWFVVEGILEQQGRGAGTRYRCRFAGCGEEEDMWLPASQITVSTLTAWRRALRGQQQGSPAASQHDSQPASAPARQPASQPASQSAQHHDSQVGGSPRGEPAPAAPRRSRRRAGLPPLVQ
jgi:hypothetical protein